MRLLFAEMPLGFSNNFRSCCVDFSAVCPLKHLKKAFSGHTTSYLSPRPLSKLNYWLEMAMVEFILGVV